MNTAFGRKFSPYDIHDAVGEKDFCTRQAVVEWPVSLANWPTLLALFPEFQLTVQLGTEVIASLNSIPLAAPPVSQLDDGGWDWALETGISGKRVERPANCLCGLQIGICREMQGKGLAGMMIALMKALAQKHGFSRLIIPVRPAGKALFPLISMEEYCRRKRSDGLPADPWRPDAVSLPVFHVHLRFNFGVEDMDRNGFSSKREILYPRSTRPG